MIKSRVSNPTRYSLQPDSMTGVIKKEGDRQSAVAAQVEGTQNDFDNYMHNLKNRYVTALEN